MGALDELSEARMRLRLELFVAMDSDVAFAADDRSKEFASLIAVASLNGLGKPQGILGGHRLASCRRVMVLRLAQEGMDGETLFVGHSIGVVAKEAIGMSFDLVELVKLFVAMITLLAEFRSSGEMLVEGGHAMREPIPKRRGQAFHVLGIERALDG